MYVCVQILWAEFSDAKSYGWLIRTCCWPNLEAITCDWKWPFDDSHFLTALFLLHPCQFSTQAHNPILHRGALPYCINIHIRLPIKFVTIMSPLCPHSPPLFPLCSLLPSVCSKLGAKNVKQFKWQPHETPNHFSSLLLLYYQPHVINDVSM